MVAVEIELMGGVSLNFSSRRRKTASSEKKVKISNDKSAFATFYADERNKNKWWTPTATPENPLVEVFLLLMVMLPGGLGRLANGGGGSTRPTRCGKRQEKWQGRPVQASARTP